MTRDDRSRHFYGKDLYSEATSSDATIGNLGPLEGLAGTFEGIKGVDTHPEVGGSETDHYLERYEAQPIDRQTNGPQLFYGLRYHTHIVKVGEIETFHDQVGYWLWEPALELVTFSLTIPRGQVLLASGRASANATEFEVTAELHDDIYGILSNPFLDENFKTTQFTMQVTTGPGPTWSYAQDTVLVIPGLSEPFHHRDSNTLSLIAPPAPNPLAT